MNGCFGGLLGRWAGRDARQATLVAVSNEVHEVLVAQRGDLDRHAPRFEPIRRSL